MKKEALRVETTEKRTAYSVSSRINYRVVSFRRTRRWYRDPFGEEVEHLSLVSKARLVLSREHGHGNCIVHNYGFARPSGKTRASKKCN